jgi:hypothetical protein
MSDDSSKKAFWHWPKNQWGILGGLCFGLLALIAPIYLLQPLFTEVIVRLPISANLKMSVAQAAVAAVALLIIAGALAAYNKKFRDVGFTRPTWQLFGKAILGFLAYIVATIILASLYQYLFHQPDQPQNVGYSKGLGGLDLVLAGITLVVLIPLKEELIFRGFMFAGFRRRLPFWIAATGVSAIFGLVHGQWNVGIDVFAMSMVSCYLVEHTKSLWPSIFLHAIKNCVAFYLLYLYNGG